MTGRGGGAPIAEMRRATKPKKKKAPSKSKFEGYAEGMGNAMKGRSAPAAAKRKEAPAREEGGGKRRRNPGRTGKVTRYLVESRLPDGRTTLRQGKM